MKLERVNHEFLRRYFAPGSQPTIKTLHNWINSKKIPGGYKMGGRYFIDTELWPPGGGPR